MSEYTSDIDFVLLWVDGNDPEWQESKAQFTGENRKNNINNVRYRDWDLLHYWFRSVEAYAPWVRKIHFVTCGQVPKWLRLEHPKLHFVKHSDYMDAEDLPTFSSHPIELNMHRIEGLSEKFVYFNDDVFLTAPVKEEDFFVDGLPRGCAVLNPPTPDRYGVATVVMNDLGVIADHFDFQKQFRENRKKWLSPVYGVQNLRTLLLLPWRRYLGFLDLHLCVPFLKSTFEEVWQEEGELLKKVSGHRFRTDSDVNQWLMIYWQLAKGRFVPGSPKMGRMFYVNRDMDAIVKAIEERDRKVVCINDSDRLENFQEARDRIAKAFDRYLGEKSSFEK